jgi:formate hydrogenlyase subunit 3/multisubunit Na+/H+ antiporter MnhD subunit
MSVFGVHSVGPVALFAMAGALLHVLNHACSSPVSSSRRAVIQAVGTREIDLLGGVQKRMPRRRRSSDRVRGRVRLPPLNGFVASS